MKIFEPLIKEIEQKNAKYEEEVNSLESFIKNKPKITSHTLEEFFI